MFKWLLVMLFCAANIASAMTPQQLATELQQTPVSHGAFQQMRYFSGMPTPVKSRGEFALDTQLGLLWQQKQPFAVILKVTPQGIFQATEGKWIASETGLGSATQTRLFLAMLKGDLPTLAEDFKIRVSGDAHAWQATLVPSALVLKKIFTQIILQGGAQLQQVRIEEVTGDYSVITLTAQQAGWLPAQRALWKTP